MNAAVVDMHVALIEGVIVPALRACPSVAKHQRNIKREKTARVEMSST